MTVKNDEDFIYQPHVFEEILIPLEEFEQTKLDNELNEYFGRMYPETIVYQNIERTYLKYLLKECNPNITIVTNKVEPQIYKCGIHKIKIINEK